MNNGKVANRASDDQVTRPSGQVDAFVRGVKVAVDEPEDRELPEEMVEPEKETLRM
jgi:hypothetical protein